MRRETWGSAAAATVCGILAASLALGAERQEASLNGTWEYVRVAELTYPPPADGWQAIEVPGQLSGFNYERAWFRCSFAAPNSPGQRFRIHFGGVKWNSQVYVNGKQVGGNLGGYEPFDVDITDAVVPGAETQLLVGVHDWTGVFVDRDTEFGDLGGQSPRYLPRDEAISPIGGHVTWYGIWDDVKLITHDPVYVSDIFIKTSVEDETLTADVTVTNATAGAVSAEVAGEVEEHEAPDVVSAVGPRTVEIPPGESRQVVLQTRWEDAHLWSHLDPHLYVLKTTVAYPGGGPDILRTRFGFREFTAKGPDFYLNGKQIHLLATSWWPSPQPMSPEDIRDQVRVIKGANCVAFRTHTQPWRERWYEIADEMGLMMIPEGAVWNDDALYRLDDQRWWDNYALHLTKMVDRDKNKPSVVMWSLENEFYGGRMVDGTPYEEKLAEMGRIVKAADPTRPIVYESDGDPGGVADVIGIHYPHEYPDFTLWPNEADWLENPIPMGHAFTGATGQFAWEKDKPLYIGEFLWIPSSDPSWDTVWFGDETYRDYHEYHRLAKAVSWRDQIVGYRRHEVSGISPWTMIEGGPLSDRNPLVLVHRYAYQPIAAFPREYDSRFFGGETVRRTIDVFNDSFDDRTVTLEWVATYGERKIENGQQMLGMASGAHEVVTIRLGLPAVRERTSGGYTLRVKVGQRIVFEDRYPLNLFPRPGKVGPGDAEVRLFDPRHTTAHVFADLPALESLSEVDGDTEVLIIGAGALSGEARERPVIGRQAADGAPLPDWVAAGGRAIVLEQSEYPPGVVPVELSAHASTMTYPQMPAHPLLRDVEPAALQCWRGDHTVTAAEPVRPTRGACTPVVVSGSRQGIAHAPLMVVPYGDGAYILCQLKVVSKYRDEPIAGVLLRNLIAFASDYPAGRGKTALYCDIPSVAQKLQQLRLEADDVADGLNTLDLADYDLLIYASPTADPLVGLRGRLDGWIGQGGNLLIHGLAPGEYGKLGDLADPSLHFIGHEGPALRAATAERLRSGYAPWAWERAAIPPRHVPPDPLLFSFTNEDLYWLGEHHGVSWATTPLSTTTTTAVFERGLDPSTADSYAATDLALLGTYVSAHEDGVIFASAGTGTMTTDFPQSGEYVFGLVAKGTPCDGVYPMAAVKLDGAQIGTIAVRSGEWETYTTYGEAEQGEHKVQVAFINDASNPPIEDRNLYLKTILIAPSEGTDRASLLTKPAALARFPRGRGSLVIDNITWDTEERNATKASRFICGLLTGLGARFRSASGVTVEAEDMEPEEGMPHFARRGGIAYLAASGYVQTEIEVARAGRYRVEVIAGGTQAEGVYPAVEVALEDVVLGEVQTTSAGPNSYSLEAELPAGVGTLRLRFTNDLYNPPDEDRNLALDKVIFYTAE
jgi:beta-galactosidase